MSGVDQKQPPPSAPEEEGQVVNEYGQQVQEWVDIADSVPRLAPGDVQSQHQKDHQG